MHYTGRKVVVTGADGFIGSHVLEALVAAGAEVTALALYNAFDAHCWLDDLPPRYARVCASCAATCAIPISLCAC